MKIKPWEHPLGKTIWKSKSAFMAFIRGGIRRGLWEKHPFKLEYIKQNRKRVPLGRKTESNPEGLVWGGECALCGNDFRQNDLQIDHRNGNNSLKSEEDILDFILNMIYIDPDKDLQMVCKECHSIKSNAERKGITYEQSKIEKLAISVVKAKKDKEWLEAKGIAPETNQSKRRQQIIKWLEDNNGNI